jgi:hemoglobin/transferrin/lactoferrin receptor protein
MHERMPRRLDALALACLAALGLPAPARAASIEGPVAAPQDEASPARSAVLLPGWIVVAARRAQPSEEVAGTVSVIDRPQIERLQAQDIRDLVRYEPGVRVAADPSRFGLDGFNIRGVQGNRVAMRVDGVPLPDAFTVGSFSNAGRDQVDPEFVQRLEILRGPASALYGSDALGGIVAFTTRAPADLLEGEGAGGEFRSGWSGRDEAWRVAALGAWQGPVHGALLALGERRGHEVENQPEAGAPPANPADTTRSSALAKWTTDLDAVRGVLSLERYDNTAEVDVRSLVNGPGQFATTESLLADDREVRERALASLVFPAPAAWLDEVEVRAWWQGSRTEQDTTQRRRAAPPAQRFPTLRARSFEIEQWQQGLQATARSSFEARGTSQQWVYGVEAFRTRVKERRDGTETNLTTGATTHVILGERLPVRDFPNSVLRSEALFASGELAFDGTPWSLLAGARWDRFRVDAEPDALYREDFPDQPVSDARDSELTPKLGLRWDVAEHDRLWLAWAEGFRAPPFSDVNIGLVLPQFNYVVLPNPDLEPERSRGIELGWNHDAEHAQWRLSAFDNRYRNLIETRANLGTNAAGAIVFQSVNRARARIRGVEGSARFELAGLGESFAPWALRAAFSWARGDDTNRDVPLNTVQPDRVVLGAERAGAKGWPTVWAEMTAVARVDRVDRSTADLFAPPGHVLFDLGLRQDFGHGVTLDAAVLNVGDVRYWEWAALRSVLRSNVPAPSFYTGPGRSVAVTLTLDF